MSWKPTTELRFVKRVQPVTESSGFFHFVLQQKWVGKGQEDEFGLVKMHEEWRDVPVVDE